MKLVKAFCTAFILYIAEWLLSGINGTHESSSFLLSLLRVGFPAIALQNGWLGLLLLFIHFFLFWDGQTHDPHRCVYDERDDNGHSDNMKPLRLLLQLLWKT